jgi:hypothetical protein
VTRPPGGAGKPSIPSGRRGSTGFQRVVSNDSDRRRTRYALPTRRSIKLTVMLFLNFAACLSLHLNII